MQSSRIELFDHVNVKVKDITRSKDFYRSIIECLGHHITREDCLSFGIHELTISEAVEVSERIHLAFKADSPAIVKLFHKIAIEKGASCNGAPKERKGTGYYSAYVLDPDGNNIEAVYRSSPYVGLAPNLLN